MNIFGACVCYKENINRTYQKMKASADWPDRVAPAHRPPDPDGSCLIVSRLLGPLGSATASQDPKATQNLPLHYSGTDDLSRPRPIRVVAAGQP